MTHYFNLINNLQMKELLNNLGACSDAKVWAANKTWPEIFETCHRGDWLLWLFRRTNPADLQRLTLAKGHCANTVRHLMKDVRSTNAVDTAIKFGEGTASREELDDSRAYSAAAAADADAYAAAAYAADAYAAAAAAYADAAAAAAAAYADAADAAAAADARAKNQAETADICRKYLPIEVWNIKIDQA